MPKLNGSVPKMRTKCVNSNKYNLVTLNGKDIYLGKAGTAKAKREYERVIGEWLAAGRQVENNPQFVEVAEVCVDYTKKAGKYYRKNGVNTNEYRIAKNIMKDLRAMYGRTLAAEFGPIAFKAFRQTLIERGLKRSTINHYLQHVISAFRFAVENEKLPETVYRSLNAVERLRKGRCEAPESQRVKPADAKIVSKTIMHLPPVIADMVRLQLVTAMRPAEVCDIRPKDVDRSGEVWIYTPASHKTEHHDRERIIPIGKEGQRILAPYLLREETAFCFSPAESMTRVRDIRTQQRVTAKSCGNRVGTNRKRKPKRKPGGQYNSRAYGRRIREVCKKHGIPTWAPNQLRKLRATEIRAIGGLEAAQVILGHSSKAVTEQYYADPNTQAAIEVARKIG